MNTNPIPVSVPSDWYYITGHCLLMCAPNAISAANYYVWDYIRPADFSSYMILTSGYDAYIVVNGRLEHEIIRAYSPPGFNMKVFAPGQSDYTDVPYRVGYQLDMSSMYRSVIFTNVPRKMTDWAFKRALERPYYASYNRNELNINRHALTAEQQERLNSNVLPIIIPPPPAPRPVSPSPTPSPPPQMSDWLDDRTKEPSLATPTEPQEYWDWRSEDEDASIDYYINRVDWRVEDEETNNEDSIEYCIDRVSDGLGHTD
jgi:hypothetical protein